MIIFYMLWHIWYSHLYALDTNGNINTLVKPQGGTAVTLKSTSIIATDGETPVNVIINSVVDSLAQCSEAYDSKASNLYTKFLCKKAFDVLENGILNEKHDDIAMGSLYCGLGFGNSSTTLGHALSYVFSNEGVSHGHALAFTTTLAHKFNDSIFYQRFLRIVKKLNFQKIYLKQDLIEAATLILTDRKHLDNNPKDISKNDLVSLLEGINNGTVLDEM